MQDQTLPVLTTSFIGRVDEVRQITSLLQNPHCRLITLAGGGGVGKSRLALEIAAQVTTLFPDGVFVFALPLQSTPNQILFAIQEKLQILTRNRANFQQQVFDFLQDKDLLLVFDNFETGLHGEALILTLIAHTRKARILLTAREPLGLREEWVQRIQGLPFPDPDRAERTDGLNSSAMALFIERGYQASGRRLSAPEELTAAAQICRIVGGNPLAIELAAGWLQFFSCVEIAAQLSSSIDLLTARLRDTPERHRSMHNVLEESWKQLTEEDRLYLLTLAVFSHRFRAEDARHVGEVDFMALCRLVEKSLLQRSEPDGFQLHDMVRLFIQEKLGAQPERRDEIEDRFIGHFAGIVHANETPMTGRGQRKALDEIERVFAHIQSAWHLAVERKAYNAIGEMLVGLNHFCFMRGYAAAYREMSSMALTRLAPMPGEKPHKVWRMLATRQDFSVYHSEETRLQVLSGLEISKELGDVEEVARGTLALGRIAAEQGNLDSALHYYQDSLRHYRDLENSFYTALILSYLGKLHLATGSYPPAEACLSESLVINQKTGNLRGEAYCLESLAVTRFSLGKFEEAYQCHVKANQIYLELEMHPAEAFSCARLGSYSMFNGDFEEARQRCETTVSQALEIGYADIAHFAQTLLGVLDCLEKGDYATGRRLITTPASVGSDPAFIFISNWGSSLAAWGLGDQLNSWQMIRKALEGAVQTQNTPLVLFCFPVFAALLADKQEYPQAAELLAAATEHTLSPNKWMEKALFVKQVHAVLVNNMNRSHFEQAWQAGAACDPRTAASVLLQMPSPNSFLKRSHRSQPQPELPGRQAPQSLVEPLTEREMEVLDLLVKGFSNRQIAAWLTISLGTAKTHIHNIYTKLGTPNRVQTVEKAKNLFRTRYRP